MGGWAIGLLAALAMAGDAPPSGKSWGQGTRGVLLLHDEGRTEADWKRFGERLAATGFRVLAPELGGAQAIESAIGWLEARGVTSLHVVGAGHGANRALVIAGPLPIVADLVLISPRPGSDLAAALARFGERPLLVVAAEGHALASRTASFVHEHARGDKHLRLYPGGAAGARLLSTTPQLEPLVLSWLTGHFRARSEPSSLSEQVRSSAVGDIETRGVRLDERRR